MDFVIALDAYTLDTHPSWPAQPITALWDYPELFSTTNSRLNAPDQAVHMLMSLRRRIELLVSLHSRSSRHTDLVHDLQDMSHL
jgi:hypothetical protein